MSYLDKVFAINVDPDDLVEVAEICCGQGEAIPIFEEQIGQGIGVDISPAMLEKAKKKYEANENFIFVQGDATMLPLGDNSFKSVIMLGGIHHVTDREKLFSEVFRILKPGGRFYFREPVSDFFLWHWIRAIVYRISPVLDANTERPLLWKETVPVLQGVGFELITWKTYGFFGFCLFMNSDVLLFNKLFSTTIDEFFVNLPGLGHAGLQVVGVAKKPLI
jgi:SAM-dependent methyltransferase